jgi:hypothetical protein
MSQSASSQASQSAQGQSAQVSQTMGGGGGRGGSQAEARDSVSMLKGQIGDGWDGAKGKLQSEDMGGRADQYSPYYRNAMKQYMERVAKERAKAGSPATPVTPQP